MEVEVETEELQVEETELSQVEETDLEASATVSEGDTSQTAEGQPVQTQVIHLGPDGQQLPVQPRAKQKQYLQRYRREWERLPFCRGWLQPHSSNRLLAFCKACNRALHARKNDLRKHSNCDKHKNNMECYLNGIPVKPTGRNLRATADLLADPDLAEWCVKMPGRKNRVWCRLCCCSLIAQRKSLLTHGQSRKHQGNIGQPPSSPPPADEDNDNNDNNDDNDNGYGGGSGGDGDFRLMEMSLACETPDRSGREESGGGPHRAASPLVESDFAGRVTYSIGLGNRKVGFLGAGQISQAIAQGMLEQGLLLPHDVIVGAPSQRNMMQWKRWKCKTTNNNDEVVSEADIVFVAVKASVLVRMIGRLTPIADGKTRLFISVVPGVTRERMAALLSCRVLPAEPAEPAEGAAVKTEIEVTGPPLHVIRCAPNKMLSISAGFCAYCMGEDVPHALYLVVETMFSALGTCVQVEEHLMDAYSTMIASGAAFTCAFIEAMVQGGVSLDLSWDEALKVASSVVSGTSKLLLRTSMDPSTLRKSISTPGGSTIAGLAALQRGGLDDAVGKALQLACDRTREVGDSVCGSGGDTSRASM